MKFLRVFIAISLIVSATVGQERYSDVFADSVEVNTFTYAIKEGQNLDMDIYTPFSDPAPARALIIYVHGGGFQGGNRNSAAAGMFCRKLASLGYVSVSVSYRLTRKGKPEAFGCGCPAVEKLNTFNSAVEDLRDATYALIQNRDHFRIDPTKIILAGSSAGAETVLNAAYMPPLCYGLESGPVSYAAVISMAGAIPDTTVIYQESAIPSLFFHGTCDPLVPYASAPHHYCDPGEPGYLILHGAYTLSRQLARLQIPFWLHTTCGGNHKLASSPMNEYFDIIRDFCHIIATGKKPETRITVVPGNQRNCTFEQFDFCDSPEK